MSSESSRAANLRKTRRCFGHTSPVAFGPPVSPCLPMSNASNPSSPLLIDFDGLSFIRGDKLVLRDVKLRILRGEHVAILGPNGSGKSTLIKAITRELYPFERREDDRYQILGQDDWDINDMRGHLGIVALDLLQNISREITLREVTARELVLSGYFNSIGLWPHHRIGPTREKKTRQILRLLKITHLADRSVAEMSSGEQRRAIIGRALVHDPAALILDEPTNSLDPGAMREFREVMRVLAQMGKSIILITHTIADVIPEIDRIILMSEGRIVADGGKNQILTSARLSALFGEKLRVIKRDGSYDLVSG